MVWWRLLVGNLGIFTTHSGSATEPQNMSCVWTFWHWTLNIDIVTLGIEHWHWTLWHWTLNIDIEHCDIGHWTLTLNIVTLNIVTLNIVTLNSYIEHSWYVCLNIQTLNINIEHCDIEQYDIVTNKICVFEHRDCPVFDQLWQWLIEILWLIWWKFDWFDWLKYFDWFGKNLIDLTDWNTLIDLAKIKLVREDKRLSWHLNHLNTVLRKNTFASSVDEK